MARSSPINQINNFADTSNIKIEFYFVFILIFNIYFNFFLLEIITRNVDLQKIS